MGWLEGLLTGYADRHYEIEKQKRDDAAAAADREGRMFETLLSSPYKDLQDYAAAGILDLGNPRKRKGGIAGWMGEIEQTPYLDMIRRTQQRYGDDPGYARANLTPQYLATHPELAGEDGGELPTAVPSIPSPAGSVAGAPAGQPAAAQPSTSLVTGGPATPATPAPTSAQAPPYQPSSRLAPYIPTPPSPGSRYGATPPPSPPPGSGAAAGPAEASPQLGAQAAPAGPPLAIPTAPPPRPPGQAGAGLPGGTTRTVGAQPPQRLTRTQLPSIFPTAADATRQNEQAQVMGQIGGWQMLYQQMGDPDWRQKGIAAVLNQKRTAAGQTLREGNIRQLEDGSYVQDLYDPISGQVAASIPSMGPAGSGTVQTREAIAFRRYGKQGEDPRATLRRLTPTQMSSVLDDERDEHAATGAEAALARAKI